MELKRPSQTEDQFQKLSNPTQLLYGPQVTLLWLLALWGCLSLARWLAEGNGAISSPSGAYLAVYRPL